MGQPTMPSILVKRQAGPETRNNQEDASHQYAYNDPLRPTVCEGAVEDIVVTPKGLSNKLVTLDAAALPRELM